VAGWVEQRQAERHRDSPSSWRSDRRPPYTRSFGRHWLFNGWWSTSFHRFDRGWEVAHRPTVAAASMR
jgi:hypothetical protein